jgi:hypothetical protein
MVVPAAAAMAVVGRGRRGMWLLLLLLRGGIEGMVRYGVPIREGAMKRQM